MSNCHDARAGDPCYVKVAWAMRQGIWQHPEWYPNLTLESRLPEFQALLHKHGEGCPWPCTSVDARLRRRGVPGATLDLPGPWGGRKELTFYVFQVVDPKAESIENSNAADLAGILWRLHNATVPNGRPAADATRIARFMVTMKTTWNFYNVHGRQFGPFAEFRDGQCTQPHCDRTYRHFGYIVGCRRQDSGGSGYASSDKTYLGVSLIGVAADCKPPACQSTVSYSFPGPCPASRTSEKNHSCARQMPGGRCSHATGSSDCTYNVTWAGEVSLNELAGIQDYGRFLRAGGKEYDPVSDVGTLNGFWNGRRNPALCSQRVRRAKELFDSKFPNLPPVDGLADPPCDFDSRYDGELDWPVYSSPLLGKHMQRRHSEEQKFLQ